VESHVLSTSKLYKHQHILHTDQNLFEKEDILYQYTYNVSPQPNWRETSNTERAHTKQRHSFQPNDTPHQGSTGFLFQVGTSVPKVSTGWYKSSPGLQLGGTRSTGLQLGPLGGTSHFPVHNTGLSQAPTSIIIKLKRVYLVNNITLELVQSSSQYTIQVSRDNKTWRQLIDYSRLMTCTGMQVLWFPKQAVRYRITLSSITLHISHASGLSNSVLYLAVLNADMCSLLHHLTA